MSEQRHSSLGIHPLEPDESGEPVKRGQVARRGKSLVAIVLLLLAGGAGRTVMNRISNARVLETPTTEHARQYVKIAQPGTAKSGQKLSLPGTLQGFIQSPISARASGYLRRWYKDIGSRVEKGELLAE